MEKKKIKKIKIIKKQKRIKLNKFLNNFKGFFKKKPFNTLRVLIYLKGVNFINFWPIFKGCFKY